MKVNEYILLRVCMIGGIFTLCFPILLITILNIILNIFDIIKKRWKQ